MNYDLLWIIIGLFRYRSMLEKNSGIPFEDRTFHKVKICLVDRSEEKVREKVG